MLESLEFRGPRLWSCIVQHALMLLDLLFAIFVFCLIWLGLQVGTWGGVMGGCKHIAITNGQFFLRLTFNSSSNACNCSVFIVKCFFPLINSNSQIMLCTFCLVTKSSLLIYHNSQSHYQKTKTNLFQSRNLQITTLYFLFGQLSNLEFYF